MPRVRRVEPKLWNLRRQVLGNLIPAVFSLPIGIYGVVEAVRTQAYAGPGIWMAAGSILLMWILVNYAGAFENSRLKRELKRRMAAKETKIDDGASFVGFARPAYVGWLDPHEDIGFLCLNQDAAEFHGETIDLAVAKNEIEGVRYRFNFHTLAGLGRWVSIEGKSAGVPFRLLVEPREKATLLGNLFHSKSLRVKIEDWLKA